MKDIIFCKENKFLKREAESVSETVDVYSVLTWPLFIAAFRYIITRRKFSIPFNCYNKYIHKTFLYTAGVLDITGVLRCKNIHYVSEIFTDVLNIG